MVLTSPLSIRTNSFSPNWGIGSPTTIRKALPDLDASISCNGWPGKGRRSATVSHALGSTMRGTFCHPILPPLSSPMAENDLRNCCGHTFKFSILSSMSFPCCSSEMLLSWNLDKQFNPSAVCSSRAVIHKLSEPRRTGRTKTSTPTCHWDRLSCHSLPLQPSNAS